MEWLKKVWNKLKTPKLWFLIVFYVLFVATIGGTITLVVLHPIQTVWHYVMYILSAIFLAYFVVTSIYITPKIKQKAIDFMQKHKYTNEFMTSYGFRTIVIAGFSFLFNVAYVAFMGILGIITGSVWYITITAYYLLLTLLKSIVFYSKRKKGNEKIYQAKNYRDCGVMLILMMCVFGGVIVLIYTSNMHFEYAGLMIYVVAVYTFVRLGFAIYNIFKARRQDDLYIQSIRNINLASALISLIVLQVALIQEFSPENSTSFAHAITGAVIGIIVILLGVYMIIKSNKILNQQEEIKDDKQE